jgi:polygalacturonase
VAAASQSVFSLDRYGARGDGSHDDTQALAQAWNAACTSPRPAVLLVPGGKRYLLKLVTLHGPCKSSVTVTVKGTLVASPNRSDWSDEDRRHWIVFRQVDRLTVNGGGAVDGNGETWWKNSCKINKALVRACIYLSYVKFCCKKKHVYVCMFLTSSTCFCMQCSRARRRQQRCRSTSAQA